MAKDAKKSSQRSKRSNIQAFVLIVLLLLLIVQTAILWRNGTLPSLLSTIAPSVSVPGTQNGEPLEPSGPTPTPTVRPLPQGRQEYIVGEGSNPIGPKITKLVFDPQDPKVGTTFSVHVFAQVRNAPIQSIVVTVQTDNTTQNHPLSLTSGTAENGEWSGTWTEEDTHLYTFITTVVATDATGQNIIGQPWREPQK